MYAKIQITGKIKIITGMHIGGNSAFSAIGSVDSPVMKDVRTNLPLLPGSSLKGKMRSLLARRYNEELVEKEKDCLRIARLFGKSEKDKSRRSRLLFSDMIMCNAEELREKGLGSMTEVKSENTINRLTGVANPRQIERVVRDAVFKLDLIYNMEDELETEEDFETLAEGMKLLQYDYLGGHGSRGYGKIKLSDLNARVVVGEVDQKILKKCIDHLNEVQRFDEEADL